MTAAEIRRILRPLAIFTALLILMPPLLLGGLTRVTKIEIGNDAVLRQASAVAGDLATELGRAAEAGIPLDRIPGLDRHLEELRAQYPSIRFFALLSPDGRVIHFSGPRGSETSVIHRLTKLAPVLAADGGVTDLPIERRTGGVALNRITVETPQGNAGLLFGVEPAIRSPAVTPEYLMLGSMMAVLLLLGLPVLYDMCRRFLFQPIRQLDYLFAEAAEGRFRTFAAREMHPDLHPLVRLWNNEVLSLEERSNQFDAFAQEAIAAADDPMVAKRIAELQLHDRQPFRVASDAEDGAAGFGAELRVPALLLAFLTAVTFGNWPDGPAAGIMIAALLAGVLAGHLLMRHRPGLVRGLLSGGCIAMALAMLVGAMMPFLMRSDDIPGAIWVLPNAVLLGFLAGAVLRQAAAVRDHRPLTGIADDAAGIARHELPRLALHAALGICAAAIWSLSGPSAASDTLEAWIAAALLPIVALRLQSRP